MTLASSSSQGLPQNSALTLTALKTQVLLIVVVPSEVEVTQAEISNHRQLVLRISIHPEKE